MNVHHHCRWLNEFAPVSVFHRTIYILCPMQILSDTPNDTYLQYVYIQRAPQKEKDSSHVNIVWRSCFFFLFSFLHVIHVSMWYHIKRLFLSFYCFCLCRYEWLVQHTIMILNWIVLTGWKMSSTSPVCVCVCYGTKEKMNKREIDTKWKGERKKIASVVKTEE